MSYLQPRKFDSQISDILGRVAFLQIINTDNVTEWSNVRLTLAVMNRSGTDFHSILPNAF